MKYVFVCEAVFPEDKGGVERWFRKLSIELSSRGHDVTYLNASGINELREGVLYKSITKKNWFYLEGGVRSKRQALNFAKQTYVTLKDAKVDVVYATSVPILALLPIAILKFLDKKMITFIEWHEIWPLRYWISYAGKVSGVFGWIIQLITLQIGDFKVTYTEQSLKAIKRLTPKSIKARVLSLPGMCDPVVPILNPENNEIRKDLSFLGRFVDEKQPLFALDCAINFIDSGWSGHFWVMGKGPALLSMEQKLLTRPNYCKQIKIIENPTDEIVEHKLKNSFALLHPSKREGYGLASIEAAYLGTPSILLDYPNNGTIDLKINPDLVVREFTVESVAKTLQLALDNQLKYRTQALDWSLLASKNQSLISTVDNLESIVEAKNAKLNK